MDNHHRNLEDDDTETRPSVMDKREHANNSWHRKSTFNFHSLAPEPFEVWNKVLVVPPLHIKIGVVNKIIDTLDLVVHELENVHDIDNSESSAFRSQLSKSFSKWEDAGHAIFRIFICAVCTSLMLNMETSCEFFFRTPVDNFG